MTAAQAGPDSPSEAFANFQGGGEEEEEEEEGMVAAPSSYTTLQRPYPARPIRAEILDDWSAKVRHLKAVFVAKYRSSFYMKLSSHTQKLALKVCPGLE